MHDASSPLVLLLLSCCLSLVACNARVLATGEPDRAPSPLDDRAPAVDGGAPLTDRDAGAPAADPSSTYYGPLPTCAPPSGPEDVYTSTADAEARIAGTWLLCTGHLFSPADTAGIEISKGKARLLVKQGEGLATRAAGDYQVDVTFLDDTTYQIGFEYQDGRSNYYRSRTSKDGRFLELFNLTSSDKARYVRVGASTKPPPGPVPSCAFGNERAFTSAADVTARISGKWERCSGDVYSPPGSTGIEFAAPRAYYLVDAGGVLSRVADWDYERNMAVVDVSASDGPGPYRIDLSAGGATGEVYPHLSESGDVLRLIEGTSFYSSEYRRVP